jgi:hypothetical protein
LYEHRRINSSWMVWELVKEIKHNGLPTMMELLTMFIKEDDIFGYNSRWELSKVASQPSCELVGKRNWKRVVWMCDNDQFHEWIKHDRWWSKISKTSAGGALACAA